MSELLEANRPQIIRGRRECRMRVAPVAACAAKSTGVSNYRYTATAGIPCTMVLTVSFVLSSVTIAWLPPSSADRSAHLAPALERQDHTTSPSAQPPFVLAIIALGDVRPSHPIPNGRNGREPPLLWKRATRNESNDLGCSSITVNCAT